MLSMPDSELEWHSLNGLWIDSSDSGTTLTLTHSSGTFVIDKVGLIMMVDDPDHLWNYTHLTSAQHQTPAVIGDIVNTATEPRHLRAVIFTAFDIFDAVVWEVEVYVPAAIPPQERCHFNEKISCNAKTPYRLSVTVMD